MARFDARLAGEAGLLSIFAEKICERERKILLIFAKRANNGFTHILFCNRRVELGSQRTECTEAAFADDPLRFFAYHAEVTGDFAVVVKGLYENV